jgi:hypothetical protein
MHPVKGKKTNNCFYVRERRDLDVRYCIYGGEKGKDTYSILDSPPNASETTFRARRNPDIMSETTFRPQRKLNNMSETSFRS